MMLGKLRSYVNQYKFKAELEETLDRIIHYFIG